MDPRQRADRLAEQILELDRNALLVELRFLDMALSRLRPFPDERDQATDGQFLYYNSRFILSRYRESPEQSARDLLHSVLHCVFRHMYVSALADPELWDLACDIAVENAMSRLNVPLLGADRAWLQEAALRDLPEDLAPLTADRLYRYFLDLTPSPEERERLSALFRVDGHDLWYRSPAERFAAPEEEPGPGGAPEETGPEKPDPEERGRAPGGERGEDGMLQTDSPGGGAGGDASPAPGGKRERPGEEAVPLPLSRKEAEIFWKDAALRMEQELASFAARAGEGAGALVQNLRSVNREKADYGAFLRRFASRGEVMRLDEDEFDYIFYTYGLRLYGNRPLVEPLEYREVRRVRDFVIAIDTSGSVRGELVQRFVEKTYNILLSTESFFTRINLHILQCDAKIQEDRKITSREEFLAWLPTMRLRGFGGTDFRPVFEYVDRLREQGEFQDLRGLIYLTDGLGVFPVRGPDYHAAFVFLDDAGGDVSVPPWAAKLVLTSREAEE